MHLVGPSPKLPFLTMAQFKLCRPRIRRVLQGHRRGEIDDHISGHSIADWRWVFHCAQLLWKGDVNFYVISTTALAI